MAASMRSILIGDVAECANCGYAIVETETGWTHLRVGWSVSQARTCSSSMVAEPVVVQAAKPRRRAPPSPASPPMRRA